MHGSICSGMFCLFSRLNTNISVAVVYGVFLDVCGCHPHMRRWITNVCMLLLSCYRHFVTYKQLIHTRDWHQVWFECWTSHFTTDIREEHGRNVGVTYDCALRRRKHWQKKTLLLNFYSRPEKQNKSQINTWIVFAFLFQGSQRKILTQKELKFNKR